VAYRSGEPGRAEIYVRPLAANAPDAQGRWQISTGGGGGSPVWSQDRRHLFFTVGSRLMVIEYSAIGNSFVPSKPRVWSDAIRTNTGFSNYDVAPDGKRVAMLTDSQAGTDTPRVTLILNFMEKAHRLRSGK
jgi:hypothetical protein